MEAILKKTVLKDDLMSQSQDVDMKKDHAQESCLIECDNDVMDVDGVLYQLGGFGRFQWFLLIACTLIMPPDIIQALNIYFVGDTPAWKVVNTTTEFPPSDLSRCDLPRSDWEYTKPYDYSLVTEFSIDCGREWQIQLASSSHFVGMAFGAIIIGWLSDNYGRKTVLVPFYLIMHISALASSVSPNIWLIMAARFVIGFSVPVLCGNLSTLMSELVLPSHRAKAVMGLFASFPFVNSLLSLVAYLIPNWRYLIAVSTFPSVLAAFLLFYIPESVCWLQAKGRDEQMHKVLGRIAKWNKRPLPEMRITNFNTQVIDLPKTSPMDLFSSPRLAKLTLVQGFTWFVSSLLYFAIVFASSNLTSQSKYINFAAVCLAEMPGLIIACFVLDRFGRKRTVMLFMLITGVCCVSLAAVPNVDRWSECRLALGFLGRLCACVTFLSMYLWTNEVFPTSLRGQGIGYCSLVARFGGISAPWLTESLQLVHPSLPFSLMGFFAVLNATLLTLMPETKDKQLQ